MALCFTVVILAGCGESRSSLPERDSLVITEADTIITTASALIGGLSDMTVGPGGSLYLVDQQTNEIHIIDHSGTLLRSIGREGSGPGELRRPRALRVSGDTLWVVDAGNARIQGLSVDGRVLASRSAPATADYYPSLRRDGTVATATLGRDSALAKIFDREGTEVARVGIPEGPPTSVIRLGEMKEQIAQGEVPVVMLNTVEPVLDEEAVWLMGSARGTIERYSLSGERLDSVLIEEPEFLGIHEAFVAENSGLPPQSIFFLRYFLDARAVGDGLWVLLAQEDQRPATILIVEEGRVRGRLGFAGVEGAGLFAVDEEFARVYFAIPETAEVVRVELPAGWEFP
jgi:hypothetical protein